METEGDKNRDNKETIDANADAINRKLFVGGLNWITTEESLKQYFNKYGDIEYLEIIKHKSTQRPRGFAFVIFNDIETAQKCLKDSIHIIDGKKVDVKKAIPCEEISPQNQPKKLFVGGLHPLINENVLKEYFEQFGVVKSVNIVKNRFGVSRGFGFVTFEETDSAIKALEYDNHILMDRYIGVRVAEKKKPKKVYDNDYTSTYPVTYVLPYQFYMVYNPEYGYIN